MRSTIHLAAALSFIIATSATGVSQPDVGAPTLEVESSTFPTTAIMQQERRMIWWSPLIPVLFFDHPGEAAIPERYVQFESADETVGYADSNTVSGYGTLPKYREILNIIGERMQRYGEAELSLRGSCSSENGESLTVANQRAETVRDYLMRIWEIDAERLVLQSPIRRAKGEANNALQEEARRVEFSSNVPEIFGVVLYRIANVEPFPVVLSTVLTPNVEPSQVDSVIYEIQNQNLETSIRQSIPGSPDSSTYSCQVYYQPPAGLPDSTMALQVYIRTREGEFHASRRLLLPVETLPSMNRKESSLLERVQEDRRDVKIPFITTGDSTMTSFEMHTIVEILSLIAPPVSPQGHREKYLFNIEGNVGIGEVPGLDTSRVNGSLTDVRRWTPKLEANQADGSLTISYVKSYKTAPNGRSYPTYIDFNRRRERTPSEKKKYEKDRDEKRRRELEENPELLRADTIADGRARAVAAFIADSVDVPLGQGNLGDAYRTIPSINVIPSKDGRARSIALTPEERWYLRGVSIQLYTERGIESVRILRLGR